MHPALEALDKGHELVLVHPGTKVPRQRNWPELSPTGAEVEKHVGTLRGNWGIKLRGLMVVDKDAKSRRAYDWMRSNRVHRSPFEVQTRNGVHFYYRLAELHLEVHGKIKHLGMPVDLLTGNRFALGPGSFIEETGHTYTLREGKCIVSADELPEFPLHLLKEPDRPPVIPLVSSRADSVRKYIRHIVAVSGQRGHAATYRCACKIADSGLSYDEGLALLIEWNETNALPLWSLEELRHKLSDAFNRRTS